MISQFRHDGPSIPAGQHDVQDGQIVGTLESQFESRVTILGHVNVIATLAKPFFQVQGRLFFVFNNEDFHGELL